jgi:hypothetical protein
MRRGFTTEASDLQLPRTANALRNEIEHHITHQELTRTTSAQKNPFITLWSSERFVEDQIIHLRRHKDGRISEKGHTNWRLYKIDGKKLGLLKIQVVRIQDIVERDEDGEDDDESYEWMFLIWSEIPEIAVVMETTYDEIKQKRLKKLEPGVLEADGRQLLKGKNKGTSIAEKVDVKSPLEDRS